ncbi:MAG: N-acetylmuramoyl-L-alanine amidase [Bacteroidota bacterium]
MNAKSYRWLMLTLMLAVFGNMLAQTQSQLHVTVEAQKGDGVYILLDRYQLRSPCNINYFYKVNNLKRNQGLREGRSYFLPILVYQYNGKSIRSTTKINDRPWAENVQLFNDVMNQAGLKAGDYRKDKILWVPYHSLHCAQEKLDYNNRTAIASVPITPNNTPSPDRSGDGPNKMSDGQQLRGTYDIFGPDYARVPLQSTALKGYVYYIVGGHGGPDPGAVGRYGKYSLCEDEYAYDVSLRLAWNLLSYGATVYLITRDKDDGIRAEEILECDKDETCWVDLPIPINQSKRLTQRSDAINALYKRNKKNGVRYQRLVVIHVDSNNKGSQIDLYFYHKQGDATSKALSETLRATMKEKYDYYRKERGYKGTVTSRDLHMLRETDPTAVFIELGNIRNPNDQARVVIAGNRQLLANWLFEGLLRDAKRQAR